MIILFEEFSEKQRQYLISNNLTYIRKNLDFQEKNGDVYDKIKKYDFNNFNISESYTIILIPDDGFKKLLIELNNTLSDENKIDVKITFELSINYAKNMYNEINIDFVLPDVLKGLNIGYKIYKLMVQKYDYITSKYGLSNFAKNLWYKFMVDSDYYCFTSNLYSGIINKDLSDNRLHQILEDIRPINKVNIEYDDKLKEKIILLYGSIENYKK